MSAQESLPEETLATASAAVRDVCEADQVADPTTVEAAAALQNLHLGV